MKNAAVVVVIVIVGVVVVVVAVIGTLSWVYFKSMQFYLLDGLEV